MMGVLTEDGWLEKEGDKIVTRSHVLILPFTVMPYVSQQYSPLRHGPLHLPLQQ